MYVQACKGLCKYAKYRLPEKCQLMVAVSSTKECISRDEKQTLRRLLRDF